MFDTLIAAALLMAGAAEATPAPEPASAARPRHIPAEDFAVRPMLQGPMLSPDGTKLLARLDSKEGKQLIGVYDLDSKKTEYLALPEKQDLSWYRWAGPNRVLISVAQTVAWYGDEAQATRLFSYDLRTHAFTILGSKQEGLEGDDVLYVDPAGDWILLSFQRTIYDYPSVSLVGLADNSIKEVVKQRSDVWEWYADNAGVVRAGIGFTDDYWSMVYRRNAADKFAKMGKAKYDDEEASLELLRFDRDSDEGYVLSNKQNGRYALYRYNYATKQIGEQVIASTANDIQDFNVSDKDGSLVSATFTTDRDRIYWFDEKMQDHQARIDAALKNNENWIGSRSRDDSKMLIWSGASNDPGTYYLFAPADHSLKALTRVNPSLAPTELAQSKYISYQARDGLTIRGYLTLPLGRPAKNLPLIILPHGGPFDVRDNGDYDPEVQLLANRGYAVLQPNFRGSGSYGKDFYEKGEGQWGRKMQDDLDDGMDWLVKQGTVDPKRVCLVGASYGGYAALWGATRNPERYRCAASFAGVSDLGRQLKYQLAFRISKRYRKDWRQTVQGAEDFDPKTVSPLYTIDKLKVPVLLAHGDADQTVPYKQSRMYADALGKAGKTVEFYTYADEGHGFSTGETLKDWLTRLDTFVAKYNPAD